MVYEFHRQADDGLAEHAGMAAENVAATRCLDSQAGGKMVGRTGIEPVAR